MKRAPVLSQSFKFMLNAALLFALTACGARATQSPISSAKAAAPVVAQDLPGSDEVALQNSTSTPDAVNGSLKQGAILKAKALPSDSDRLAFRFTLADGAGGIANFTAAVGKNGNAAMTRILGGTASSSIKANLGSVDEGLATVVVIVSDSSESNRGRAYVFKRDGQTLNYSVQWVDSDLTRSEAVDEDSFRLLGFSPEEAKAKATHGKADAAVEAAQAASDTGLALPGAGDSALVLDEKK